MSSTATYALVTITGPARITRQSGSARRLRDAAGRTGPAASPPPDQHRRPEPDLGRPGGAARTPHASSADAQRQARGSPEAGLAWRARHPCTCVGMPGGREPGSRDIPALAGARRRNCRRGRPSIEATPRWVFPAPLQISQTWRLAFATSYLARLHGTQRESSAAVLVATAAPQAARHGRRRAAFPGGGRGLWSRRIDRDRLPSCRAHLVDHGVGGLAHAG